jgi:hypothetical protein
MLIKSATASSPWNRKRGRNAAVYCICLILLFFVWSVVSELLVAAPPRDIEHRLARSTPLIDFIRENCCYDPYCNFQTEEPISTTVCNVNYSYSCDKRCLKSLSTTNFANVEMSEAEAFRAHQHSETTIADSDAMQENDMLFHVYWDPRGGKVLNDHIKLSLYSILATQRNPNAPFKTRGGAGKRKRDDGDATESMNANSEGSSTHYALPRGKAIVRLWTPADVPSSAFLADKVLARAATNGRLIIAELDEAAEIASARTTMTSSLFSFQRLKQRVLDLVFFRGNVVGFTDLLRYLLTFNYGGVYLDADVMMLRDITPLLNNVCLILFVFCICLRFDLVNLSFVLVIYLFFESHS